MVHILTISKRLHAQVAFVFLLFAILSSKAVFAGVVSASFVSKNGAALALQINISSNSPLNLIVEQSISAGNTISSTSPRAVKVTSNNSVKWLLRNAQKGSYTLSTYLKAPLRGRVEAVVRYRSPNGGAFQEVRVSQ